MLIDGPNFEFRSGQNGSPDTSGFSGIGGPVSHWHVQEWGKQYPLNPQVMSYRPGVVYDWKSPESELAVWPNGYELVGHDGQLKDGGGRNLFLEAGVNYQMDQQWTYTLTGHVSVADIDNGYSLGQMFTGFSMVFNLPGNPHYDPNQRTYSMFMQIGIANSHNNFVGVEHSDYLSEWVAPGDSTLTWAASTQDRTLNYDLNQHVRFMAMSNDISNWTVTGIYVGLEQFGHLDQGLKIANLDILPGVVTNSSIAQPASYLGFQKGDLHGTVEMDKYSGPVSYLNAQSIFSGPESISISTAAPSVFIATGSGDDAVSVSSGQNVIDGGTGSNFLTGGSGTDTFFLDIAGIAPTWDTIVGFHSGDAVTIWNSQGVHVLVGQAGAPGATGATFEVSSKDRITFAGLSDTDAQQLAMVNGSIGGRDYLYVYHN